ncbi:MAG: MoaD/ThiS family protein [Phycisphaeraceae bacterium]|nr:MoaD/ThiS family protein [Phycisphaerales bacterium]QOJ17317.1 MAG: MoaD/ThiS family protein [Phycisphaeraceae bacterium]
MPTLRFTENIQRHVPCPTRQVSGATVRAALDAYFADNVRARGYVLDEVGSLRQHMVIFVDGRLIADRRTQSDPVDPASVIDVMQALSGG